MNLEFELWSLEITPELWAGNMDFHCDKILYNNLVEDLRKEDIQVNLDSFFDEKYSRIYFNKDLANIETLKKMIKVIKSYGGHLYMKYEDGLGEAWKEINNIVEYTCEKLDYNIEWFMSNKDEICKSYAKLVSNICYELGVECKVDDDLDRYNLGDYEIVELKIENGIIMIQ